MESFANDGKFGLMHLPDRGRRRPEGALKAILAVCIFLSGCNGSQTVDGSNSEAPRISINASPNIVSTGEAVVLTWSSTGATSCIAAGGWAGDVPTAGTREIVGLTTSTDFDLRCVGSGGVSTDSVTVVVDAAPNPTVSISATPEMVTSGGVVQLTWSSTNSTSCTASGGWIGPQSTSGTTTTDQITSATEFVIQCTGVGGSAIDSVTVIISSANNASALSGFVDSSLIDVIGSNKIYLFRGDTQPDDVDGDSGDPLLIADVKPVPNTCTYSYSFQSVPTGQYTVAMTNNGDDDGPGQDDLSFFSTSVVEVGGASALHSFNARNIIKVGQGRRFESIADAAMAAVDGDVISVDSGEYLDDIVVWRQNKIVIRGAGGRAHVRGTQIIPFESGNDRRNGKGLWVIQGNSIKVESIEFSGARVTDENGAGIRIEGRDLSICDAYFHDNENGILGAANGRLLIEYSEFHSNGNGDVGRTHNVYIVGGNEPGDELVFRYNNSHNVNIGHLLKSRARDNYILYNRLMDETEGTGSYNIDLPNGGLAYIIGNSIEQGPKTDNSTIISFGAEGLIGGRDHSIYLVNNTIVNDLESGAFLDVDIGSINFAAINNLYVGEGSLYVNKSPNPESNNIATDQAGLSDRDAFDYRIVSTSPAIDSGIDPGAADGFELRPKYQYVHPNSIEERPVDNQIDVGAFEFSDF